jgi:hypothetical protein
MPVRNIHPIIRQIIDRDCHVSERNCAVVRHVISKLKNGYETFRDWPTGDRRQFVDQCIAQHRANQRLYAEVMNGFPTCKKTEREMLKQIKSVSPTELAELILENAVTQQYLAFRLGWSIGRVKAAYQYGLRKPREIELWLTAISEAESSEVPRKSRIRNESETANCNFCGCPITIGDQVFEYRQNVYCSNHCCRMNCGW